MTSCSLASQSWAAPPERLGLGPSRQYRSWLQLVQRPRLHEQDRDGAALLIQRDFVGEEFVMLAEQLQGSLGVMQFQGRDRLFFRTVFEGAPALGLDDLFDQVGLLLLLHAGQVKA